MPEVLVLVDHVDGTVRKPTYELLTIAKRIGQDEDFRHGSRAPSTCGSFKGWAR